jgi:hypothetical protein
MRGYFARFFVNHERTHRQLHLMEGTWVNAIRLVGDTKFVATNESAVAVGALGLDKLLAQSEANDFFEKRFKMAADAVTAYEALAADARQAGGFLSDHQVYSSREVPETAKPKLAWQEALDRCLLTFTLGRFDWSLPIDPAAVREPIYLWLKAAQAYGDDPKKAASAKPLVVEAQTEVEHRSKAKTLCYSWSFPALEVEAEIYDLLYSVHINTGEDAAAFSAIQSAIAASISPGRMRFLTWMQCYKFPQFRDDAFETAFGTPAEYQDTYDLVMKHADYPAYVARRKLEIKSGKAISRWSAMTEPARVKQINAVEKFIGHKLPTSYRKFLKERGRSELNLLKKRQRKTLQFAGANDLVAWHETVQAWIVRSNGEASEIAAAWRRAHRIDYSQLCSVATPWDNSSALVMNLGPGQAFGRCFLWHHDEPSDLVPMGKDFDEALELVMRGFEKGDKRLKAFLL